ncbi:DivIVA domain-containing protein [Tissierella creatinini]|nr:DivIVA domain-containing protein [Tissierella creatinini]TJX69216.1 DivIVA domain-containing protein [Soehngenia saccharolytica]
MITPLDIQNKNFKRNFRGYNAKSVDIFLDEITIDYEKIYKENIELKDKTKLLSDQIKQYSTMEETLKKTLIMAQTTADEVASAARQKAENIIRDAELEGKKHIEKAHEDVRDIKREYDYLKKEIFIFKTRYESFIQAQLLSMDDFYKDMERVDNDQATNTDFSEAIKEKLV